MSIQVAGDAGRDVGELDLLQRRVRQTKVQQSLYLQVKTLAEMTTYADIAKYIRFDRRVLQTLRVRGVYDFYRFQISA